MTRIVRNLASLTIGLTCCLTCFVCLAGLTMGAEPNSLVTNGNFEKWSDGAPDGWFVETGATNGAPEPKSEVKQIPGPALMLRGNAATRAWQSVGQEIAAQSGESYVLTFDARTKDIRREGQQFNNCYVGVLFTGDSAKVVGSQIQDVSNDTDWVTHRVAFRVPPAAATTRLTVFLSKSGILGVRNVAITKTAAAGMLTNGGFSEWANDAPSGWKVDIGARNGADAPKSQVTRLDDPGLQLSGDASTLAWHSVSQELALRPGGVYTLEFMARSDRIRREGRQFDNCYVGFINLDRNGQKAGQLVVEDLSRTSGWRKHRLTLRVPPNAAKTDLTIFLSKSGTLAVKNLELKEASRSGAPFRGTR